MKIVDISGKRFGRITVLSLHYERTKTKGAIFNCKCDCGTEKLIDGASLKTGKTKSCGCYRQEILEKSGTTHGMCGTGAWHSWRDMMKRCYAVKSCHYHHYGGRGIEVCKEWHSFAGFHSHMGDRPAGMSIERRDVDGNYEPGNCSWIPVAEQQNNKRTSIFVEIEGEKMCLSLACKRLGIKYNRVRDRIQKLGWPIEKALYEAKKINGEKYA